jgi:hypothetical protein
MLEYNIAEGKVRIDGVDLSLKFISDTLDKYPEQLALKILTYMHLVSKVDSKAPFFTADEKEISTLVSNQIFESSEFKKLNKKSLNDLVTEYKKTYETPEIRIVNIFNNKVDQIRELIESTEPEIEKVVTNSGAVSFVSNVQLITKTMNELGDLLDVKDKLEAKIRKQNVAGSMRGGKTPSLLEKQMMK